MKGTNFPSPLIHMRHHLSLDTSWREPLRVLLLGAGFNTDNLGVGALTMGAINCIRARFPRAKISLLDYGTADEPQSLQLRGEAIQIPVVNMRFSWRIYLGNNIALLLFISLMWKLTPSRSARDWIVRNNKCLRSICEAGLIASIAGGDSFSDIYGLERLLYVSLPQVLAILLNKRLVLLPQTMGPFRGRFSRNIARYIVRRAEHVYSRDREGLRELEVLAGDGLCKEKTSFCYDVGFAMDPRAPEDSQIDKFWASVDATTPRVGMNISGLLYLGGYTRNNMFGLRADYREFVQRAIDLLILKKGASVVLIPHVFGSGERSESDLAACDEVYQRLKDKYNGRLHVIHRSFGPDEMKYLIGQCDFFVGSRMHACIAAVSQCIPATSIAYSDKFLGVMGSLGIESSVADARVLTQDELLDAVERNYDRRSEICHQLEEKMKEVKLAFANMFMNVVEASPELISPEPVYVGPPTA